MPVAHQTIFYSWQSDVAGKYNRSFIEAALQAAITRITSKAAHLEPAERPLKISLDKDTKGVPGSPPITSTILNKIEGCSVFVADLTFVGQSLPELTEPDEKPRFFPNPNVLLEYGYALRHHGHARIIGVFNTAYGGPMEENLPFDLRHLRHPIRYSLKGGHEKAEVKERLIDDLVAAIEPILNTPLPIGLATADFRPADRSMASWNLEAKSGELIVESPRGGTPEPFAIPPAGMCYLRLYPREEITPIPTEVDAKYLAISGRLRPMAPNRLDGVSVSRNRHGAIAYQSPRNGILYYCTQLFLSGEIFGVDAGSMTSLSFRQTAESKVSVFDVGLVEESFVVSLTSYQNFALTKLSQRQPWKIEAGLSGVDKFEIMEGHRCLQPSISWIGETDGTRDAVSVLRPFFEYLWKKFGSQRASNAEDALRRRF